MSSPSLDANQIHYLRTVLGVDSIIWPRSFQRGPENQASHLSGEVAWIGGESRARLVALFPLETGDTLTSDQELLVEKMIRAMKVSIDDVRRGFWPVGLADATAAIASELERHANQPVIVFGTGSGLSFDGRSLGIGESALLGSRRVHVTYSPRDLIDSPERKRLAWVHLQAVMKEL